jgi:porin
MTVCRYRRLLFVALLVSLPGVSPVASAQTTVVAEAPTGLLPIPDYSSDLATRKYLLGDWGGARSELAEQGMTLDWTFTQIGSLVKGGVNNDDKHYGGKSEALFTFELDRMGVLNGALVTMRLESRTGDSANSSAGTLLPINDVMFFPQPPDEDFPLYITELRYTQFLTKQVGVFAG